MADKSDLRYMLDAVARQEQERQERAQFVRDLFASARAKSARQAYADLADNAEKKSETKKESE